MRVVIFGSTGGTGLQLVEQALERGHLVTAFVRNPAKLAIAHKNLTIAKGDVLDYAAVEAAVRGQDAVLSALGARTLGKTTMLSEGTKHILAAMEKLGVRRFVSESSLGVGDSYGQLGFLFTYVALPLLLRRAFADKEVQERAIRSSGVDWVIVRPAMLTNGPRTGKYRTGFTVTDRSIKGKISRADVADFMLKQMSDDTYLRKTPGVSY
jgi:putative NADH-flavin reductase